MGEGSASGVPWGAGSGKATWEGWGGEISNGISNAQRCETPLRCPHVAPETTRDGVGLGDPVERFLASTGSRDRGWDGRQLAMT
jgi:hypothetical protein